MGRVTTHVLDSAKGRQGHGIRIEVFRIQKEKFLKPLLNGDKRICFSMTEKAAGADATGMQTTAVKDGNENYILNGEKWFSSSASVADMAPRRIDPAFMPCPP